MINLNKGISTLLVIVIIVVVLIGGGVAYYYITKTQLIFSSVDYSKEITGRFILKDSKCAGFEFIGGNKIIWRNELTCQVPDELSIFWLNNTTFVVKDIEKINENCPPRVDIYVVEKFNGKNLILKDLWTGWGDYEFTEEEYVKSSI